jgi:hypothetical protein
MRNLQNVIYIIAIFLFTSCVTQRACLEKFPPDTVTVINTIYRDTIIEIKIEKLEPRYASSHIDIPLIVRYGPATFKTWVQRDSIFVYATSVDTSLWFKLDSAIKVINRQDSIIQTYRVKYVPKWIRDLAGFGGLIIGSLIVFFILRVIKFFK